MGSKARQAGGVRINGVPQQVHQRALVRVVSGGKQQTLRPEQLVEMLKVDGMDLSPMGDAILLRNQFAVLEVNGTAVRPARNVTLRENDTLKVGCPSGATIHCQVVIP